MKEAIAEGMRTLKKEIAAALHISGKYDMELKADIARTRGYSRTLGEHIWKTDRDAKNEMDAILARLDLIQGACDEVSYLQSGVQAQKRLNEETESRLDDHSKAADKAELVDLGLEFQLKAADRRIDGLLQVIALHAAETD